MLITLAIIKAKHPCSLACKMYPTFAADYPQGVQLNDLLDRSDADAPDQMEWLCKAFGPDIEVRDYSGYRFTSKSALVRYRPDLCEHIGFDQMTAEQQRTIELFCKASA